MSQAPSPNRTGTLSAHTALHPWFCSRGVLVSSQHSHDLLSAWNPRTVSLPLSVQLSTVLPRLILWLIQTLWLLNPLQANVGYYGDAVTIQVAGLNRPTS
jgi:hypothetical protein